MPKLALPFGWLRRAFGWLRHAFKTFANRERIPKLHKCHWQCAIKQPPDQLDQAALPAAARASPRLASHASHEDYLFIVLCIIFMLVMLLQLVLWARSVRVALKKSKTEQSAAIKLQSVSRMRRAYLYLQSQCMAVLHLQSASRRRAALKAAAATTVQREARRMFAARSFAAALCAVVRVQSALRGWRVFGVAAAAKDARALLIGQLGRASLARRMVAVVRLQETARKLEAGAQGEAAQRLTRVVRGHLAREQAHRLREAQRQERRSAKKEALYCNSSKARLSRAPPHSLASSVPRTVGKHGRRMPLSPLSPNDISSSVEALAVPSRAGLFYSPSVEALAKGSPDAKSPPSLASALTSDVYSAQYAELARAEAMAGLSAQSAPEPPARKHHREPFCNGGVATKRPEAPSNAHAGMSRDLMVELKARLSSRAIAVHGDE